MQKQIYKAVVIGAGEIGALLEQDVHRVKPASHAGAYSMNKKTVLSGIVDSDKKKLRVAGKIFPHIDLYSSAEECLHSVSPDIVSIATGAETHEAIASLCIQHQIPIVILEKPVSLSLESAMRIRAIAKKSRTIFILNHQRRFFALFSLLKKKLDEGKFGHIQQVTAYYNNGLFNNGTHIIDALRFLLSDEVDWVEGSLNKIGAPNIKGDVSVDGLVHFKRGTTVALQSFGSDYAIHELHLFGSKGACKVKRYGFEFEWMRLKPSDIFTGYKELVLEKKEVVKTSMLEGVVSHAVSLLKNSALKNVSTLDDGVRDMIVLDGLKRSAKQGGVRIPITYEK